MTLMRSTTATRESENEEDDGEEEGKRKMDMGKTFIKMPRWNNSRKNTSIFIIRSSKRLLFTILLFLIINLCCLIYDPVMNPK